MAGELTGLAGSAGPLQLLYRRRVPRNGRRVDNGRETSNCERLVRRVDLDFGYRCGTLWMVQYESRMITATYESSSRLRPPRGTIVERLRLRARDVYTAADKLSRESSLRYLCRTTATAGTDA